MANIVRGSWVVKKCYLDRNATLTHCIAGRDQVIVTQCTDCALRPTLQERQICASVWNALLVVQRWPRIEVNVSRSGSEAQSPMASSSRRELSVSHSDDLVFYYRRLWIKL